MNKNDNNVKAIEYDKVVPDYIAEGFHRLDKRIISKQPKKIKWGPGFQKKNAADQLKYLENLAHTMNHAAALIQDERNILGKLCEKKEAQLEQMKLQVDASNDMMIAQLQKINEERQQWNAAAVKMKNKIRDLEKD